MSDSSKHSKLFFIFLFFLVSTFSLVLGQPPIQEQGDGLSVETARLSALQQNQNHEFYFHTSNTTQTLSNATTTCDFDLYGNDGQELYDGGNIEFLNSNEWRVNITSGNFSKLGEYSSVIYCNTSSQAGFVSFGFDVTADGKEYKNFPIHYFLIIISTIFVLAGFVNDRMSLLKTVGSILFMIMGLITIYPGYNFVNYTNITGFSLGVIFIGIGFYFMIENSFSRSPREDSDYYERGYYD